MAWGCSILSMMVWVLFLSLGCVRPNRKEACAWEQSDYCPCVRMNKQGKEWRRGEDGMRGVVILLPIVRFNPLVECACGKGLTVLPHSTPSHKCPS